MHQPSPEVLARLEQALVGRPSVRVERHRDRIRYLVTQHRATEPRVFDVLVEFTDDATLLDEVGLRLALSDLLQDPHRVWRTLTRDIPELRSL
ncbi:hypothetical protein ACQBAU_17320 [Propionibacteriaceae bacterium Y2011]|uniref:hypothetical protein n=1 Tax=Microlunatus sp. Y2014 TaxID=3418488 RepID=UPI003B457E62